MNRSRAKGTAWESAIVAFLNAHGFRHAERRALRGSDDRGDIAGIPGVVLSAKACKEYALGEWTTEMERMIRRAQARLGVLVIKRRQKPVGDAYVVMTLSQFCALIRDDEGAAQP